MKNKPKYELLICDLDGTLLDENSEIPLENINAVSEVKKLGMGFTLATGRMDGMIRVYVRQLNIKIPVIACNGAVIRDCETEEIIAIHPVPENDFRYLSERMTAIRQDFLCYTPDAVYFPAFSKTIARFHAYNRLALSEGIQTIPLYPLEEFQDEISTNVVKIMTHLPVNMELSQLKDFFQKNSSCTAVQSMDGMADIMKAGVSKGQAMRFLAARLDIKMKSIIAIGDQENDIDMLAVAGMGIAMGNAIEAVKSVSKATTETNINAGVAKAIYNYCL